jgi:hypothetical protein
MCVEKRWLRFSAMASQQTDQLLCFRRGKHFKADRAAFTSGLVHRISCKPIPLGFSVCSWDPAAGAYGVRLTLTCVGGPGIFKAPTASVLPWTERTLLPWTGWSPRAYENSNRGRVVLRSGKLNPSRSFVCRAASSTCVTIYLDTSN